LEEKSGSILYAFTVKALVAMGARGRGSTLPFDETLVIGGGGGGLERGRQSSGTDAAESVVDSDTIRKVPDRFVGTNGTRKELIIVIMEQNLASKIRW
jgi:hypothetical protein